MLNLQTYYFQTGFWIKHYRLILLASSFPVNATFWKSSFSLLFLNLLFQRIFFICIHITIIIFSKWLYCGTSYVSWISLILIVHFNELDLINLCSCTVITTIQFKVISFSVKGTLTILDQRTPQNWLFYNFAFSWNYYKLNHAIRSLMCLASVWHLFILSHEQFVPLYWEVVVYFMSVMFIVFSVQEFILLMILWNVLNVPKCLPWRYCERNYFLSFIFGN